MKTGRTYFLPCGNEYIFFDYARMFTQSLANEDP